MLRHPIPAFITLCVIVACTPLEPRTEPEGGLGSQGAAAQAEGGVAPPEGSFAQGEGGVAGDGGPGAGPTGPLPVETGLGTACPIEGGNRCSAAGAGARQVCQGGLWTVMESCPGGQICQEKEGAAPVCQTVAEVCKGSAGMAVCDGQGNLLVCNADGTVASQQPCSSARLCQLGLAARRCAQCVPSTEFRCTGALLEVCAADGQSWTRHEMCTSEALCNKIAGMCTTSACAANKAACNGNTLTQCNADGSAFAKQTPCPAGTTCDALGGDCNMCEPGMKKCENGMVMTCDATGQMFTASACPGSQKCVGAGQCAACAANDDCTSMTQGCRVGVCGANNMCSAQNAAAGTACTTSSNRPGTCSNGSCVCTPQCTGKQCGDDTCGGQCPSRCSFAQSCSMNRCVDCTTNADCSALTRDCQTGSCSAAGTCTTTPRSSGTCTTSAGVTGTCSAGTCTCTPNCGARCGGSNGCGGTCPNTCDPVTQTCNLASERCNDKPFITCPANRCPSGMICASVGYCVHPCSSGSCGSLNGQLRVCVGVACLFAPSCPSGLRTTTVPDTSGADVTVCGV